VTKLNIVILAAGIGKRMNSKLPKVLHPLAGKPLLRHVLDTASSLSPHKICVVYGHGGEQVPALIGDKNIIWIKQEPQLGTGHALLQTLPQLDKKGVTLVLYGDVPLTQTATLLNLIAAAGSKKMGLLTATLDDPSGYGRIVRSKNKVARIVEEKDATAAQRKLREINTGMMVIPNAFLHRALPQIENRNAQREYYLTDLIALAANTKAAEKIDIVTVEPEHPWETLGVNSKNQLAQLERIYQTTLAARLLQQGVTLLDPARFDQRGELICGHDVEIDINAIFSGEVHLGDGVRVGANCILKNVRVAHGTQIAPFSHIEDAVIGANCRIGPYARIRPGTRLAADVHIGNFVEVKNSQIEAGSKANHLSYVGDAAVGKNVNIGAGTITCNYDGANKHQTIIEDDVFIGSDTQLVAPVKIARGATIGAGSTITKDTPADTLSLSRSKQVSVPGWKRPVKIKT